MTFLSGVRASISRLVERNLDLIGLWLALVLAQHFVPVGHLLARDDLLPWMAVALSGVAVLRGRPLGAGPHPMLTRRRTWLSGYASLATLAITPWVLLAVHDLARTWDVQDLALAGGLLIALAAMLGLSGEHERTAWNPNPGRDWLIWTFGGLFLGSVAAATGLLRRLAAAPPEWLPVLPFGDGGWSWLSEVAVGAMLGLGFVAVGLVSGRTQHHRQRKAAGRKDGLPHRAAVFPILLAALGPSVGLAVLLLVLPGLDYDFAFVVALLVVVWGAVIWPPRVPVGVACLLHELTPTGGNDAVHAEGAKPFDQPPEGALRFNPLRTKKTRAVYPWIVPVQASRIADLDDPIMPLWPQANPPPHHHVLGEAVFAPDPLTKGPQWGVLTVRLKSQEDTTELSEGSDAKTRRMVILRPYPTGLFHRSQLRTYKWDIDIADEAIQVLDSTTEAVTLRTGDVLVISSEGVAHAYEFEIGAPLYEPFDKHRARPPQLPDYVAS